MPFVLIAGTYHITGFSPDGDSVRFKANDPAAWDRLNFVPGNTNHVKLNARQMAQLRLEAIDALELHYRPEGQSQDFRQPPPLVEQARDFLLQTLGLDQNDGTSG